MIDRLNAAWDRLTDPIERFMERYLEHNPVAAFVFCCLYLVMALIRLIRGGF